MRLAACTEDLRAYTMVKINARVHKQGTEELLTEASTLKEMFEIEHSVAMQKQLESVQFWNSIVRIP